MKARNLFYKNWRINIHIVVFRKNKNFEKNTFLGGLNSKENINKKLFY